MRLYNTAMTSLLHIIINYNGTILMMNKLKSILYFYQAHAPLALCIIIIYLFKLDAVKELFFLFKIV